MAEGCAGFWTCAVIWFAVSAFLLGYSYDTLDPLEMGLLYDANTCYLDESRLYNANDGEGGRFWTGLGSSFIVFPRSYIRIKMNNETDADDTVITAKGHNGTNVKLSVSMQYRLPRQVNQLVSLYRKFDTRYHQFFISVSRSVIRDIISDHPVQDMWEKRTLVGDEIENILRDSLAAYHITVKGVQLLNLDIPSALADAIETTTVAYQGISEAEFAQNAQRVQATTTRLVAAKHAQTTLLQANATGQTAIIAARAQATALNFTIHAEADALKFVKSTFGFNSTTLLQYLYLDAILDTNAQAVVSVQQPAVFRKQP